MSIKYITQPKASAVPSKPLSLAPSPTSKPEGYVGHKHPPKAYQFKPGVSGNPNGRPKKLKNHQELFADELKKKIVVTEKGQSTKMTKQAALVKSIVNKSLGGDAKSIALVMKQMPGADEANLLNNPARPLDQIDEEILALYRERLAAEWAAAHPKE